MSIKKNLAVVGALLFMGTATLSAQCTSWDGIAEKEEAENAHVVYRPYLKGKNETDVQALSEEDFNLAFTNWEKAYTLAPAADGQRPTHYIDGIILHKAMTAKTEDAALKGEYAKTIVRLYDEYLECYPDDRKLILGRKAFDMFYSPGYGYRLETLEALQLAIDAAGNKGVIQIINWHRTIDFSDSDSEYVASIMSSLVTTLHAIKMRELIEEQNRNLEQKVLERTASLRQKNSIFFILYCRW